MSVTTHSFRTGELIAGTRYRLIRLVGEGGMGWIFDVEHLELGKRFVVKVLKPDCVGREDLVARLRNEWRALARLQHPNIVMVTDAGQTPGGVPFFVMERLEGEPLSRRMRRERRLAVPEALELTASVLDGLGAAHEIGVVHRDVKPPNIFLLRDGGVKILDFGVAKIENPRAKVITAHGIAIGTPRYMSPEQANGASIDGRADLYAIGLILFEMISGQSPFEDARDTNELLLAHLARPAPRLGELVAGVPPEVDAIVARLLAKEPRERPGTAREVAAMLRRQAERARAAVSTGAATPVAGYSSSTIDAPLGSALVRSLDRQASLAPGAVASGTLAELGEVTADATTAPLAECGGVESGYGDGPTTEAERIVARVVWPSVATHTSIVYEPDTPCDSQAIPTRVRGVHDWSEERTLRFDAPGESDDESYDDDSVDTRTAMPARARSGPETPPPVAPGSVAPETLGRFGVWMRWGALTAGSLGLGVLLAAAVVSWNRVHSLAALAPSAPEPAFVEAADLEAAVEPAPSAAVSSDRAATAAPLPSASAAAERLVPAGTSPLWAAHPEPSGGSRPASQPAPTSEVASSAPSRPPPASRSSADESAVRVRLPGSGL